MTVQPTDRHFTASMVVLDPVLDRLLLVWHKHYQCYVFPGGHVEPNEFPDQSALREIAEETGVRATIAAQGEFTPTPLMPQMSRIATPWMAFSIPAPAKPERPGKPAEPAHTHIDLLYIGLADSRQPLTYPPDEVDSAIWAPIEQLPDLTTRAEVAELAWRARQLLNNEPWAYQRYQ